MDATTCATIAASNPRTLVLVLLRVCLLVGVFTVLQSIYRFLKQAGEFLCGKGKPAGVAHPAPAAAPAAAAPATKPAAASATEPAVVTATKHAAAFATVPATLFRRGYLVRREEKEEKEKEKKEKKEKEEMQKRADPRLEIDHNHHEEEHAAATDDDSQGTVEAVEGKEEGEEEEGMQHGKETGRCEFVDRLNSLEEHAVCCRLYGLLIDQMHEHGRENHSELVLSLSRGLTYNQFSLSFARLLREEGLEKMNSTNMSPYYQLYLAFDRGEGKLMPTIRRAWGLKL